MLAALTMDWTSLLSSLNICATSESNEPGETGEPSYSSGTSETY